MVTFVESDQESSSGDHDFRVDRTVKRSVSSGFCVFGKIDCYTYNPFSIANQHYHSMLFLTRSHLSVTLCAAASPKYL